MLETLQYRLYPTRKRETLLNQQLEECRWLYNPSFSGASEDAWEWYGGGCDRTGNGLRLSRVGVVPIVLHRPVEGKIKTCTVLKSSTGKWWVTLSCENVPEQGLPGKSLPVGIDVGVKTFASLSDGTKIPNPTFFKRSAKRLAQAQRKPELPRNGPSDRERVRKIVAKVHEVIAFQRTDFARKESAKTVQQYGRIFVEDIHVNEMNSHRCLNRSLRDAEGSQFFSFLSYKAESAGREFRKINPADTSQDCSSYGHRQKMPLSLRMYSCPCCGMQKNRNHNAALNILRFGLESPG